MTRRRWKPLLALAALMLAVIAPQGAAMATGQVQGPGFDGELPLRPILSDWRLTFMQPCEPLEGAPEEARWRIRIDDMPEDFLVTPSDDDVPTGDLAGIEVEWSSTNGESGEITYTGGEEFVTTQWGTQTMKIFVDGVEVDVKAGGDSFNGTTCEPDPEPEWLLTFMQPCEPLSGDPDEALWRIRDRAGIELDAAITVTWGSNNGQSGSIDFTGEGDQFFTTAWGTQTMKIFVDGVEVDVKAGGDSFNGNDCALDWLLTFMQPCEPVTGEPEAAEWRVRDRAELALDGAITVEWSSTNGEEGSLDFTGEGDQFFTTAWGTQTMVISVDGTEVDVKAGGDSFNGTTCPTPSITLDKDVDSPDVVITEGEGTEVTYTFTIGNDGNEPLEDITLTDERIDDELLADALADAGGNPLAPDEELTFELTVTLTADDFGVGDDADDEHAGTATVTAMGTESATTAQATSSTVVLLTEVLAVVISDDDVPDDDPVAEEVADEEEPEVLGVTIAADADEETLPETGVGSLALALSGLLALGLGTGMVRRTTRRG
ncbi:MAG: hypothetical protein JJT89_15980 [Nitriliruptoraceae bacterium]|nr:hypothetical protein [Nitriliruptoraceae bacterium]